MLFRLETVYALLWAGGFEDELAGAVPDTLAGHLPHVEEDGRDEADAFRARVVPRSEDELAQTADALDPDTRAGHERRAALDWLLER